MNNKNLSIKSFYSVKDVTWAGPDKSWQGHGCCKMTQTAWLKTFTVYHKHTRCWTVWKGRRFDGLAGQWLLIRSRRIRPNCKTIFDTNLFNWSILSICDISTYNANIWHMNLTCQNCGQKRGERLQVHAGLLRCTLKRGFATPGCIAPAYIYGSYTSTFKFCKFIEYRWHVGRGGRWFRGGRRRRLASPWLLFWRSIWKAAIF